MTLVACVEDILLCEIQLSEASKTCEIYVSKFEVTLLYSVGKVPLERGDHFSGKISIKSNDPS